MTRWLRFRTLNGNWTVAHAFTYHYGRSRCRMWDRPIADERYEGKPPRGWKRCAWCRKAAR